MITDEDKDKIVEIARRFEASRVLLFGSSLNDDAPAHDIDLAVTGVPPARFFDFYGELLFSLSKAVDVVDLSVDSKFTRMVLSEGVPLYG